MSPQIQAAADDMGFDSAQDLVDMLEAHGLHLVAAADMRVLEAMRNVPVRTLLQCSAMNGAVRGISTTLADVGTAELARRECKR